MTDAKLLNGDLVLNASGGVETVAGVDAKFQSVMVRLGTRLGSFVYDRELGSRHEYYSSDPMAAQKLELLFNEALAGMENTYVTVTGTGERIGVIINIDGESRETEVCMYGDV